MIVKDKGEVWQIEHFAVVNIGKKDPMFNFNRYCEELKNDFAREIARTVYPQLPATQSHIIIPD